MVVTKVVTQGGDSKIKVKKEMTVRHVRVASASDNPTMAWNVGFSALLHLVKPKPQPNLQILLTIKACILFNTNL